MMPFHLTFMKVPNQSKSFHGFSKVKTVCKPNFTSTVCVMFLFIKPKLKCDRLFNRCCCMMCNSGYMLD